MFRWIELPRVYKRQSVGVQKRAYNILMLLIFVYFYSLGMFISDLVITGRFVFVGLEVVIMSVAMALIFYIWYRGKMNFAINIAGVIGIVFTLIIFFEPISLRFYMQLLMVLIVTFLGFEKKHQYVISFLTISSLLLANILLINKDDLRYVLYIITTFPIAAYFLYFVRQLLNSEISLSTEMRLIQEKDFLTGLPNRRSFENNLRYTSRMKNAMVMMMDIDHFKKINDAYGHLKGDEVLKDMGQIFKTLRDENLLIYRWGGEEFFAVSFGNEITCKIQAESIRESIKKHDFGLDHPVTISIGLSNTSNKDVFENCYKRADEALYRAKHNGRDQVSVNIGNQV